MNSEPILGQPLKAADLKPCEACGGPIAGQLTAGHRALDLCRLRVERLVIDPTAVNKALAMEQYFGGNSALAAVFSPGEVARVFSSETYLICQTCWVHQSPAELGEMVRERRERQERQEHKAARQATQAAHS